MTVARGNLGGCWSNLGLLPRPPLACVDNIGCAGERDLRPGRIHTHVYLLVPRASLCVDLRMNSVTPRTPTFNRGTWIVVNMPSVDRVMCFPLVVFISSGCCVGALSPDARGALTTTVREIEEGGYGAELELGQHLKHLQHCGFAFV